MFDRVLNIPLLNVVVTHTAPKMKFSIKDSFSKCYQIRWKLQIWSHLLEESWMETLICCAVWYYIYQIPLQAS